MMRGSGIFNSSMVGSTAKMVNILAAVLHHPNTLAAYTVGTLSIAHKYNETKLALIPNLIMVKQSSYPDSSS